MLKLKSLRISGVGRFVEEQTIDFSSLGNLIQVDGENRNTGGSSGSGKSTIFNALDYLLGLNDLPVTVLQSRLTKEKLDVEGSFDWDGKNVTVSRSSKLFIDIDGMVTTGSSALSEAKLDEILGMPRDVFRKILHKRQKEGGFFLEFTPKKMYEFLTDALNLATERKKLEKVEAKLSELEKLKIAGQSKILSIQSALTATQESILSLGLPPIKDIHQSVILELKEKYDVSTKRFKEVEERHKFEIQELESSRPQITTIPFDVRQKDAYESRRKELADIINTCIREESERVALVKTRIQAITIEQNQISYQISNANSAKVHSTELAGQIKKIRDAICFTCEQIWLTEKAKTTEQDIQQKLIANLALIKTGVIAAERQKVLADELLVISEQLKPLDNPEMPQIREELTMIDQRLKEEKAKESEHLTQQNTINSNILQHFATKQAELRSRQLVEIDQVRGQADINRRALEAAVGKLKAYDDAKNRYDSSLASMKDKEAKYMGDLDDEANTLQSNVESIELAEELKKAIKMFLSISFDDALEFIGDSATKIIRCIPTMSNATIQFEGQKETKDGKVKEEVNAVISMDGDIGIPIKSLSGGERSSVDLAVDLAVIDFIESESAKGIDVFILDEPFTGLDTVSIEMALEVLKNSNSTKKLIVVDHNPIIKESISNRLIVTREGEYSKIGFPT